MSFTTPEVISCLAIVISLVMGIGGFLATLLTTLLGIMIKRMVTTIEDKITTLSTKFEAMVVNKDAAHNNIYSEIRTTETRLTTQVNDIKDSVARIGKSIGRLEGAFNKNIIISKTDTHRG